MSSRHRGKQTDNAPWPDDASPLDTMSSETATPKPQRRDSLDDIVPAPVAAASAPRQQHTPEQPRQASSEPATPTPKGATAPPDGPDDGEIRPDPQAAGRSLHRRAGPQPAAPHPPRARRSPQDLPPPTSATPIEQPVSGGAWRGGPVWALAAALVWVGALALLLLGPARLQALGLPPRVAIPGGWVLAALATFLPLQVRMSLPSVTWQGALGFGLLAYLLAFVPAPNSWLLELPDVPVYLLFFVALFYAVGASAMPITYALGQRFYNLRLHRHDVGRARRQAYEVALLAVATFVLAGLRVLTPISFGLLALVLLLTEALLLSQVQPEG